MYRFYIVFIRFLFFVPCKKYYQYCNNAENIFVPSVHKPWVRTPYVQESKKLRVRIINKDVRKSLARKKGNDTIIWSWNKSPQVMLLLKFWCQVVDLHNYHGSLPIPLTCIRQYGSLCCSMLYKMHYPCK